ncbi:hypothetical protein BTUL_0002g01740 [Botrytis tulipae]|uniref:Uncharacterized protein n=1 Tax=Botrytis tulipae TaxID=87230 RepID=A0A4Z1F626_9HELO|nr:hypothetical protein BTUL_0002g01740 [Botrytis tulipae]
MTAQIESEKYRYNAGLNTIRTMYRCVTNGFSQIIRHIDAIVRCINKKTVSVRGATEIGKLKDLRFRVSKPTKFADKNSILWKEAKLKHEEGESVQKFKARLEALSTQTSKNRNHNSK